jgi:competence/damage-inducible protein CinA-like protein
MNAEIIAIGSELLLGETIDTNSAYLARQLAGAGIGLFRKTTVGDNEARIAATIAEALERADLVICTGGLGPTADDVTREAVARALGRPLVFHQHLLDQIAARFQAFGRTMSPSNRRQAYTPAGARIVENPRGTAPSFIVEDARGTVVVLPGVPFEMRYLWENAILPYLRDERGQTGVILVRTLHATGTTESQIGELLADLMTQENPTLGISAKRAQYELRIGAQAESRGAAAALADQAEAIIRARVGEYLVGDEPLDAAVARLLAEQGRSLALYEGNDRAPVYHALAELAGGRQALRGVIIHPLDRPADDAAVQSLARSGAIAARDRWRSDLALGIQPASTSGADGFTSVCVALAHPAGIFETARRYDLRAEEGWEFVGTLGLDVLRRYLLGE